MTRSVEDAALLLAALQGQKPVDLRACDLSNARFAILNTIALDDLDSTIGGAFDAAVESLRAVGAQIVPLEVPILADAMALSGILFSSEAYGTWKDTIEANPHLMYEEILHRFRSGAGHAAADYVAAWQQLDCARGVWADSTAGYDAVLVPSTANTPPKLVRLATEEAYYKTANLLTLRNTRIGNLMGLPALTVPTAVPSCGLMLMGKPLAEEHLLSLGAAVEVALG
jgi:aspartyl-tRNA(Asn)/glutamyl-tRNA(Gln) amidotransferase subunit A